MTSVDFKDIAKEALYSVLACDLIVIVICFFTYPLLALILDSFCIAIFTTCAPLAILVGSPILFIIIMMVTWVYRNYSIWKEIRDKHTEPQKYAPYGFERDMTQLNHQTTQESENK